MVDRQCVFGTNECCENRKEVSSTNFFSHEDNSHEQKQNVLVLANVGLKLRDCCYIFNRFEVKESDLVKIASLARN